ncbi:hypothetical protein [Bythopirellula polymerisocia]|uniref:Tetratricopeptide repeat protein n=1 Tax=Bythopirellula polymerisocia TaxID=2528003 RepID=A0A5C6D0Y6_9BACT|nr:hypothetical protein [Bythopirellula polymerisocia]TWU29367.1 hypothetical protein Pla144_01430 [Bythopirellula polymerisocia]
MQFGYRSQLRCHAWQGSLVIMFLWMTCALLTGCGQQENILKLLRERSKHSCEHRADPSEEVIQPIQAGADTIEWGFTTDTQLNRLPIVCSGETPFVGLPDHVEYTVAPQEMLGILLTPLVIEEANSDISPLVEVEEEAEAPPEIAVCESHEIVAPVQDDFSPEERRLLDVIARDTLAVSTGVQTDVRLDQQSREKIGAAYALAQRGASYAARQELIEVLRMISQAKDNRDGTRTRSESLAAGLRALEEAEDFVPRGTQLEAEMALEVICASHRTPLAKEADFAVVLPSQMMDRYNRYAQIKLALAVAGEPAGSMALYTLGKLNSQLAEVEPEQHRMAKRRAVAFQQAALLAHNQNYLAAHELGVLLAETGHLPEARQLLDQVARREPNAVVFRNLARVHDELGQPGFAHHCLVQADLLVKQGRGPSGQVAWVSPQQFSQSAPIIREAPQMAARPAAPIARY